MIGITVRLPASTLNAARAVAACREVESFAMLGKWVKRQLADAFRDRRVVSVAERRRLIAHAG